MHCSLLSTWATDAAPVSVRCDFLPAPVLPWSTPGFARPTGRSPLSSPAPRPSRDGCREIWIGTRRLRRAPPYLEGPRVRANLRARRRSDGDAHRVAAARAERGDVVRDVV